jgi:hypothetical protein
MRAADVVAMLRHVAPDQPVETLDETGTPCPASLVIMHGRVLVVPAPVASALIELWGPIEGDPPRRRS